MACRRSGVRAPVAPPNPAARALLAAALMLLLGGCSVAEPSPPKQIAHPSGPTDVVLRISISGGLRYPGTTFEWPPTFTLYGDGLVIYSIDRPGPTGEPNLELRQARVTEEQIAALVQSALARGGLANARERYGDVPIMDDVTTTFEVHAAGLDKTVAVYALGYSGPGVPDAAARAAFEELAERLRGFSDDVAAGNAQDLGVFEPEAYLVTLDQPFGPMEANRDWPWEDLHPDAFELDGGHRVRVVTAEQAAAMANPPQSAPNDFVALAPDGVEYLIRVRPLLPDEAA